MGSRGLRSVIVPVLLLGAQSFFSQTLLAESHTPPGRIQWSGPMSCPSPTVVESLLNAALNERRLVLQPDALLVTARVEVVGPGYRLHLEVRFNDVSGEQILSAPTCEELAQATALIAALAADLPASGPRSTLRQEQHSGHPERPSPSGNQHATMKATTRKERHSDRLEVARRPMRAPPGPTLSIRRSWNSPVHRRRVSRGELGFYARSNSSSKIPRCRSAL